MNTQNSITYKMVRTIVVLTLCFGLLVASIQVIWDYKTRMDSFFNQIDQLLGSVQQAAIKAVYTYDNDLALEVCTGLFEFSPISSALIKDEHSNVIGTLERYRSTLPYNWVSRHLFKRAYTFSVPLDIKSISQKAQGWLEVTVTPHNIAEDFFRKAGLTIASTLLESFLIAIIFLFVFYRRITRPLHLLAQDFSKINPETPERFTLSMTPQFKSTEFEEVTQAGNKLLAVIGSHLRARDHAETELTRQKNETERFLKIAEAIILKLDIDGNVIMINQRGLEVSGYTKEELVGKNWLDLALPAEARDPLRKIFQELKTQSHTPQDVLSSTYYENDILTRSGERRRIYWHNSLEKDQQGQVVGLLSSGQDITERKAAEDALHASESNLRAIIEATSEGFAITDLNNMCLVDVNSSLHNMLGYRRNDMLGRRFDVFIHPQDRVLLKDFPGDEQSSSRHRTFQLRLQRYNGSLVPVEISASKLPQEVSKTPRIVAFITNIEQRREQEESQKRLENQLRQSQKMETIGTLAGGIAHDFNNILTPILGYSSLINSRLSPDDPNSERMRNIEISARRGADMIKQILSFSRKDEGEMESRWLSPILQDALKLVRATAPPSVEIQADITKDCPPVMADNTQIQQLVLNLCTNAIQAMTDNTGMLKVQLKQVDVDQKSAESSPVLEPGPHAQLTISDNGHGMDEETLTRIFDPFFTSKQAGKGTGLGLAMVHTIVKNHKGDIFVSSKPAEGTTFTIYFPLSSVPVQAAETHKPLAHGREEFALIVDDEVLNTNFLEQLMHEIGYHCESFNDSQAAWDSFQKAPERYDIILTDHSMPKMDGNQLVGKIRELRDDIPIIMMSGYGEAKGMNTNLGIDKFIVKPIQIDALSQAMRELLN